MTIKQFMIGYSRDVISGEILACQKHQWACERFLKDIAREGRADFPYFFDDEKARRFLFWMTQFKHTKGQKILYLNRFRFLFLVIFTVGYIKIRDTGDSKKLTGKLAVKMLRHKALLVWGRLRHSLMTNTCLRSI